MKLYKNAKLAINGTLVQSDFLVGNGKFVKIANNIQADCPIVDLTDKIVLPKIVEEHTHGAKGSDFNLCNRTQIADMMSYYIENNIGTVLPTVMTDTVDVMHNQLRLISEEAKNYSEIKGIHLEGPFLCEEYKGAMPAELLQVPSLKLFDEFQKSANGLIKLITISPEVVGACDLIKNLVKQGISVNLGHSGADYKTTMQCIDAGANGFTHTFNAMKLMHQHFPNIAGAAMLSNCYCEIICDGRHLNPTIVKLLKKIKTMDQLILITDSIMAAGLEDGNYKLGVNNVTVKDGDACITETGVRAGSTLAAMDGLNNFIKWTDTPVEIAIKAMTENPARHNKLFDITGSIEEGKLAEFFIYE